MAGFRGGHCRVRPLHSAGLGSVPATQAFSFNWLMATLQIPESPDTMPSLVGVANIVIEKWRMLFGWALTCGLLAAGLAFFIEPSYVSSAAFVPQASGDASKAGGLAGLAGQLGVAIPSANQTQSPEFYVRLLRSRVLLESIARDSFVVAGGDRVPRPFAELFRIRANSSEQQLDRSVEKLRRIVTPSLVKLTGIVEVKVASPWPEVSQKIVADLLVGVDRFNVELRRAQANAERVFVEKRLTIARDSLRQAENRLQQFLVLNRQVSNSPGLTFERERLQRELSMSEQVFTTLTQSYEEVRLREVRDTPVISVLESPARASEPSSRYRVVIVLAAMFLGAFAALCLTLVSRSLQARTARGDAGAAVFRAHFSKWRRQQNPLRPAS